MVLKPNSNKRVLLVYPGNISSISKRMPLSVLFLAESLISKGFDPVIWDMQVSTFDPSMTRNLLAAGISSLTGKQILYGLEAARKIREHVPEIPIIWGGIHATTMPEQTMENPFVDFIVQGEGEETLPELLECIAAAKLPVGVPGTVYESEGKVILNERRPFIQFNRYNNLPYDLLELSRYQTADRFEYQSSRGCPYGCSFCYNKKFNFFKWRAKESHIVLDELEAINRRFGSKTIHFVDDEFFIDRKRALEITSGIISRGLKFSWKPAIRIDAVNRYDKEFFETLARSGCYEFCMGAESGSDRMLQVINKKIRSEDILASARHLLSMDIGIVPQYSFLSGFPGEREEDLDATLDVIDKLWAINRKIKVNGLFIATPFPGTDFYEQAISAPEYVAPKNLDEWGETNYLAVKKSIPYLSDRFYTRLKVYSTIIFFLYLWNHTVEYTSKTEHKVFRKYRQFLLFRFLFRPFHFLLSWRWKKRFTGIPLDVEIIRRILIIINP